MRRLLHSEVRRLLSQCCPRSPRATVEDEWATRNAHFYRCRAGAIDVVVKHDYRRGSNAVFAAFQSLTEAHAALPQGVKVPSPVGWVSNPPVLITRYIPGQDLHEAFETVSGGELRRVIRLAGRALGSLHGRARPTGDVDVIERVRRRFLLPHHWAEQWVLVPVTSTEDFSPNNVRIGEDGDLFILDPPTRSVVTTAHDDVAKFLVELLKRIGRGPLYRYLARAFAEGYGEAGPMDPFEDRARELVSWIAAYRALNVSVKYWRRAQRARQAQLVIWAVMTRLRPTEAPWLPY